MTKRQLLDDPTSCLNRALDDEEVFVLLARDLAAPHTVREWAEKRVELGLNDGLDTQFSEALQCSLRMEQQRDTIRQAMRTTVPARPRRG